MPLPLSKNRKWRVRGGAEKYCSTTTPFADRYRDPNFLPGTKEGKKRLWVTKAEFLLLQVSLGDWVPKLRVKGKVGGTCRRPRGGGAASESWR